jgi:hypothetical protein
MAKRTLKKADKPADAEDISTLIGKGDIKRSALEAWRKLDTVIQNELTSIQKGKKELTASTATAVVKYIEASAGLASGSEDTSEKDARNRHQATIAKLTLPTFDDEEDDDFSVE